MSAADRAQGSLPRRARLISLGGWLTLLGLALTVVGLGGLRLRGGGSGLIGGMLLGTADLPMIGLVAAGVVGLLATVAGLALYVGLPGLSPILARRDFDHPRTMAAALLSVLVIASLLQAPAVLVGGGSSAARGALPISTLVMAMLATQGALIGVLIWRIVRPGVLTWDDMGLNSVALGRRLSQGAAGAVLVLFVAVIAAGLLRLLGVEQNQAQMFQGIRGVGLSHFAAFWLVAAVVAPICEEVFFRGYVFAALRGRYGRPIAYLGSALLFATVHMNLAAIVPILVIGCCLAFLYDRSGSVVPGIVAHALFNSTQLLILYSGVGST